MKMTAANIAASLTECAFDATLAGRNGDKVVLRGMRDEQTRARVFQILERYDVKYDALHSGWYLTLTIHS